MKKNLTHYICWFCMLLSLALSNSCEDTLLNNMVDDRVYLLKPGLNEVQVYHFEKAVAEVVVVKSGTGQQASKVKLEVHPAVLTHYNSTNGTTYRQLPEAAYTLTNSTLDLAHHSYLSSFRFVINTQQFMAEQAKNPDVTFVIPCEVTNLNPGARDSVKMQTLIVPKIVEPYTYFAKSGFVTDINYITSKSPDYLKYNGKIEINFPATEDVDYTLSIPKNSDELINQYNTLNGTGYKILPVEALDILVNGKIKKGADYSNYTFHILKSKLVGADHSPQYGNYIVPLVIASTSQGTPHPTKNIVLIPFNYHE